MSLILWLIRVALINLKQPGTIVNAVYDLLLAFLWFSSVTSQTSSDLTDPAHLSEAPWYLTRSCKVADSEIYRYCCLEKAAFNLSVLLLYVNSSVITSPQHSWQLTRSLHRMFYLGRFCFGILLLTYGIGKRHGSRADLWDWLRLDDSDTGLVTNDDFVCNKHTSHRPCSIACKGQPRLNSTPLC